MVNNGMDRALAERELAAGADMFAFGRPYIANPDLVERLRRGGPFNQGDSATYYGGGAKGYTDYPTLPVQATDRTNSVVSRPAST